MRLAKSILEVAAVAAFCLAAFAADDTAIPPVLSCGNGVPGGIECITSKRDLKDAHRAFDRGMKFNEQRQFEDALVQFEDASRLAPREAKYLTGNTGLGIRPVHSVRPMRARLSALGHPRAIL